MKKLSAAASKVAARVPKKISFRRCQKMANIAVKSISSTLDL
jgi:hypothetical protein